MKHVDSVPARQRQIYQSGARGQRPRIPLTFAELSQAASLSMSEKAYAYVAGGAGEENTQQANRRAFDDWCLLPRMLRDVSQRSMATTLFGRRLRSPLLLCPIGALGMVTPQADAVVAQACRRTQTPMIFSSQGSLAMETCAALLGDSPRWFQLYWSKSKELVASLVSRAERCGCEAIVVTLDTPLLGWRPRDLRLGSLPFLRGLGLAQYFSDPVFQSYVDEVELRSSGPITPQALLLFVEACRNYGGNLWQNLRSKRPLKAIQQFVDIYSRTDLVWSDLAFLREHTRLPIVLKGIMCAQDARQALDVGMDAIMVSNHGGRQLDGALPALDALPEVVAEVNGVVPVLFDSGIRSGTDVYKALALGATAVGLGRPYAFALAVGGEEGVVEVIENTLAELDLSMAFSGCLDVKELPTTPLRRARGCCHPSSERESRR